MMKKIDTSSFLQHLSEKQWFFILFGLWYILNLLQACFTGLANDESYYLFYSQNLDWGYFDHPPMIALLIKCGTLLFNNTLGIRFWVVLLQPFYLWLLWDCIKPEHYTKKDVTLYFLLCFSMPLLQLYGFIAVPDAPLMFFTALFLWSYLHLLKNNRWTDCLLLALSVAALAYSKYHGALVVFTVLIANPRLFKNPKIYVSGVLALMLMIPHLSWQYHHDWVSFIYHLSVRGGGFEWSNFLKYFINILLIFNPLLLPIVFLSWKTSWNKNEIFRSFSFMMVGFFLFFIYNCCYKEIQAQWLIPLSFCVIAFVFNYLSQHKRTVGYVKTVGIICIILFVAARVFIVFFPLGNNDELYRNKEKYTLIYDKVGRLPVIFNGSYTKASKYRYYTGQKAYAQSHVYYRQSQYDLTEIDSELEGSKVAVEVDNATDSIVLPNGKIMYYVIENHYKPNKKIKISHNPLPHHLLSGDSVKMNIIISNPYHYTFYFDKKNYIRFVMRNKKDQVFISRVLVSADSVQAGAKVRCNASFIIPEKAVNGKYAAGFSVEQYPYSSWYAERPFELIVNE